MNTIRLALLLVVLFVISTGNIFAITLNSTTNRISDVSNPVDAQDVATKNYVDSNTGLSGSGTTNYLPRFTSSTALGNSAIYQNGNNIGVGTTGAVNTFQVAGNTSFGVVGTTGLYAVAFNPDTSGNTIFHIVSGASGNTNRLRIVGGSSAYNSPTEYLSILNSGNVGIGVANPGQKLVVNSGQIQVINGGGNAYYDANNGGALIKGNAGTIGAYVYDTAQWLTGTSSLNRGGSGCSYGVCLGGNTNVEGNLLVRGTTSTHGYASLIPGSGTTAGYVEWYKSGPTRIGYMGYLDMAGSQNNLGLNLENSANFIINGGRVGIGTASPDTNLHVVGQVKITGGTPGAGKVLTSDATGLATWQTPTVGTVTSIATNNGLTGGTITSTGTIGLTGQALALHNLGTNGIFVRTGAGTVTARSIAAGTGLSVSNADGVSGNPTISFTSTTGTGSVVLSASPTITGTLTASTEVSSPNYKVSAANGNGICFWADCTNYKIHMGTGAEYQYGSVTDYSIKMNMNSGASTRGWTWGYAGTTPVASISGGGNLRVAGSITAASFWYSSDENLKKNIVSLANKETVSKVMRLNPVSFEWKNQSDDRNIGVQIGLIAQEVEKIYPEFVHTNEDGTKAVQYANLVAPLIKTVQEQQKQIDSQQKQINELKVMIEDLSNAK